MAKSIDDFSFASEGKGSFISVFINKGEIVYVHTEKYPKGEIRGQIMMANSTSDKMMKMDK